jgi:hypothetical protein
MDRLTGDVKVNSAASDLERTEAELERTRERLAASLGALREEIADLADWRSWVERRPLPFLAGAFALGMIAGFAFRRD